MLVPRPALPYSAAHSPFPPPILTVTAAAQLTERTKRYIPLGPLIQGDAFCALRAAVHSKTLLLKASELPGN